MKKSIQITPQDNVATLLMDMIEGDRLELMDGDILQIRETIPYGHKVALEDILEGELIRKYDEVIGVATKNISAGQWVHIHNCKSARGSEE